MNPANSRPPFRAEHIGSLIRPPELLAARQQFAAGKLDSAGLRAIEDAAITDVVRLQEGLGLKVITDGEFRRGTYSDSFTSAGISGIKIEMTEDQGWSKSQTAGHRMARRIPKVVSRIAWQGPQNADDFRYLARSTRTSTYSGRTWSRPTIRRCARSRKRAAAIYRSTRLRW